MSSTLTYTVAVVAGLAILASLWIVSRKGFLPSLAASVALAVVAAVLIAAVRMSG